MLPLLALTLLAQTAVANRVDPARWVAFSADLKILMAGKPDAWGRFVQDEHGCTRRETTNPDGTLNVALVNFETARMYSVVRGGPWTVQPMRMGAVPRSPTRRPTLRRVEDVEGFAAYLSEITVRSPRGEHRRQSIVIPELNDFEAVFDLPNGQTITAQNIVKGPPDHAAFLPPPGALLTERPEFGGYMSFSTVVVRITFPDRAPIAVETREESVAPLRTPGEDELSLVTRIIDEVKGLVRVQVMNDAAGNPGAINGAILDEFEVALGQSAQTTRLAENFTLTVTRIRDRVAR